MLDAGGSSARTNSSTFVRVTANRVSARRFAPLMAAFAIVGAVVILVGESEAELENQVFTSRAASSTEDRLRLIVPRGWRATEQPSYPGLLLWMARTQPPGQIVLTAETFTRERYCSWPVACRMAQGTLVAKYACALRTKLEQQRLRFGPTQAGPEENEKAGLPTLYFDYEDGRRFLRQAVTLSSDRLITLVLSAPSETARDAHERQFIQTLRTLRLLTAAEAATTTTVDATLAMTTDGGAPTDATTPPTDGAALDAGVTFETPPTPKLNPVGPCPGR